MRLFINFSLFVVLVSIFMGISEEAVEPAYTQSQNAFAAYMRLQFRLKLPIILARQIKFVEMQGWKKLTENDILTAHEEFLEAERLSGNFQRLPSNNVIRMGLYFKEILPTNIEPSVLIERAFIAAHEYSKMENSEEKSRILLFQAIKLVVATTERNRGNALFRHVAFIAKQFSRRTNSPVEAKKLYGQAAALFSTLDRVIDAVRCYQAVANLPISEEEKMTALENASLALEGVDWRSDHERTTVSRLEAVIRSKLSKLQNIGQTINNYISNVLDRLASIESTPPTTVN